MIVASSAPVHFFLLAIVLIAGHVRLSEKKLTRVGPVQFLLHKLYAIIEPIILRITDRLITTNIIIGNPAGRAFLKFIALLSHYLPHGVLLTTNAAENFLNYIERIEGPAGARIAVGPCVCQRSLNRWDGPSCKDIVILYGADIYRHLDLGYRIISAAEAGEIVRQCRDAGLVHSLDFCMQSGRWAFVMCNCDSEICVLTRSYNLTGKFIYPGPEIVTMNAVQCRGENSCGRCLQACMFGVNSSTGDKPAVDYGRCLGCGQCVRNCKGRARSMINRPTYGLGNVVPTDMIIG